MSTKEYALDNRLISIYQGSLDCSLCNIEIKKGEKIVTKRSGSGKRRMYHRKCAIRLNIIEGIKE